MNNKTTKKRWLKIIWSLQEISELLSKMILIYELDKEVVCKLQNLQKGLADLRFKTVCSTLESNTSDSDFRQELLRLLQIDFELNSWLNNKLNTDGRSLFKSQTKATHIKSE